MALTKITSTNIGANAVTSALIANVSSATITSGLGYTPANRNGDTFNGNVAANALIANGASAALTLADRADLSKNFVWYVSSDVARLYNTGYDLLKVNTAGIVTMPYQPAFTASVTNGNTGTSGTIIYNSANINVGGHYNTSNGRFTAPIAGVYMFSITGISVNTSTVESSIQVNGSGTYVNARGGSNVNSTAAGYCGVILISLSVNDYVSVKIEGGVSQYGFGNYTTFSGRLMN